MPTFGAGRLRVPGAACILAALLAAGCGSASHTTATKRAASVKTTAANQTTTASAAAANRYALGYTGGKAGEANPSKAPVDIGWVNEIGATVAFPEFTDAAEVGVKYINAQLGGVDGHPVRLVGCVVQSASDGTTCGDQMANNGKVPIVLTGVLVDGGQQLYSTLAGKKPVLVGAAVTSADTQTPGVYAFSSIQLLDRGMALFAAEDLHAKRVAVIYTSDPSGTSSYEQDIKPVLAAHGVSDTAVPVSDTTTGPDVQQALLAANASGADAVLLDIPPQACDAAFDGLRLSAVKAAVISTPGCKGSEMEAHLKQVGVGGQAPNGWYYMNYGADVNVPDVQSGMSSYLTAIKKYSSSPFDYSQAYDGFSALLTTVRIMNRLGLNHVRATTMKAALQHFSGHAPLLGDVSCHGASPNIGLCGTQAGVIQYENGRWRPIRWGSHLIDATPGS